jgi:hypothetical protein
MAQVVDFPLRRPAAPPLDPEIRQTSNELVDVLQQLAFLKPSAVIALKRIAVGLLALYSQSTMH